MNRSRTSDPEVEDKLSMTGLDNVVLSRLLLEWESAFYDGDDGSMSLADCQPIRVLPVSSQPARDPSLSSCIIPGHEDGFYPPPGH